MLEAGQGVRHTTEDRIDYDNVEIHYGCNHWFNLN